MIQNFICVENSTVWDVVNNTYGSVDNIVKLMRDNNFLNVNKYPEKEETFIFDDTLVSNQNSLQSNLSSKKFATRNRTSTNEENMSVYEQVNELYYTSVADGTTIISILALQGKRIIQIEREIKPLKDTEFGFNSPSGTISLLGGLTLDDGQTLFILYGEMVTA